LKGLGADLPYQPAHRGSWKIEGESKEDQGEVPDDLQQQIVDRLEEYPVTSWDEAVCRRFWGFGPRERSARRDVRQ
jgi:hypothetical protein